MKVLRYIAAVVIVASLAACGGTQERDKATLGGTQDTTTVAGNGHVGGTVESDSAKKDSARQGNADPTGHGDSDDSIKK